MVADILDELQILKIVQDYEEKKDEMSLIKCLKSNNCMKKEFCIKALGKIGTEISIKPLKELFVDQTCSHRGGDMSVSWPDRIKAWMAYRKISKRLNISIDINEKPDLR